MKNFVVGGFSLLAMIAASSALAQNISLTAAQDGASNPVLITKCHDMNTATLSHCPSVHFSNISQTCPDAVAAVTQN